MSDLEPENFAEARDDALLQKYALGGRLKPEDLARITHLLTPEVKESRRTAHLTRYMEARLPEVETKELRQMMGGKLPHEMPKIDLLSAAENPTKKVEALRVTKESYSKKLRDYAKNIGLSGKDPERKLKRWIAKGREKSPPDLPPLDALEHMAEWWRRNMEWRVPEYLLRLETGADETDQAPEDKTSAAPPAQSSTNESKPPPDSDGSGSPMMFMSGAEMTADIGLNQIRDLVVTLHESMKKAFEKGRLTEGAGLMRQWKEAVESLRKWEKDIVKIQEGKGEVLRTRVVNTELGRILNVISQSYFNSLLSILDTYAAEIPGTDRRQLALTYRDKCFRHLKDSQFSSVYQPPEEVPPHE